MIIVTVVLNDERGLDLTLRSLLPLSGIIKQHIIIDGGSFDNTLVVAKLYKESSKYNVEIVSEKDAGIFDAMNKASKFFYSDSDYVWYLNAGDLYNVNIAPNEFNSTLQSDSGLIFYRSKIVTSDNNYVLRPSQNDPRFYDYVTPVHQSVLFKAKLVKLLPYDLDFKIQSDTKLIYKLIQSGVSISYHNLILSIFAYGGTSSNYISYRKCLVQLSEEIFIKVVYNKKGYFFIIKTVSLMFLKWMLSYVLKNNFEKLHIRLLKLRNK